MSDMRTQIPPPTFVKPVRIPETVSWHAADPPTARAGERGRWRLTFVLSEAVPDGAELCILFDGGRNVKGSFRPIQADDPAADGYVEVRRDDGAPIRPIVMTGPGTASFRAPAGGLASGERLEVILGGEGGTVAPRLSLPNKMFLLFVPLPAEDGSVPKSNTEPPKRIIGACLLHVVGNVVHHLRAYGPSQAEAGKPFSLLVRAEDEFDNVACERPGRLVVSADGQAISTFVRADLESAACCLLHGIVLDEPGIFRLEVRDASRGLSARTNAIRCLNDREGSAQAHYWGMIHGHTELSDGAGDIDHYFKYMRDQCFLDFGAAGDHDHVFETSQEMWRATQEATARYNEPGRFVTFLGYEWAKWRRNGDGDRNVYYLDDRRPMYRSDEGHYPTPPDLFRALANETAIVIPHHTANIGNHCDWKDHDPDRERLVEIFSEWGCSERSVHEGNPYPMRPSRDAPHVVDSGEVPAGFVQRALTLGWRVGFTAGGDDHQAHPGDETLRGGSPPRKAGLMAVCATDRSREAIWDAMYRRNCYGTTGARIIVDFSLDGAPMGSELRVADRPRLRDRRRLSVTVHGTAGVEKIEIVRNNEDVYTHRGSSEDESFEWVDCQPFDAVVLPPALFCPTPFCFYYVRVAQADGEMAWASPIWVSP